MKEKRKRKLVTWRGWLALLGMCGVISLCSLYYGRDDAEPPDAQTMAEATATRLAQTVVAMLVTNTPPATVTMEETVNEFLTVQVTNTATVTAMATITPTATETTVEEASSQLADRLYLQGARVESVQIADGRAAGGEIVVIVTYNVQARTSEATESELFTLFDGVGIAIHDLGLEVDSVVIVVGVGEMALGVMTASAADVISFALGGMTPQEFNRRVEFVSMIPEQQQQQSASQQQQSASQQQQPVCNGVDDLNCDDFSGGGADAHMAACGDEDRLDGDGDGDACEDGWN